MKVAINFRSIENVISRDVCNGDIKDIQKGAGGAVKPNDVGGVFNDRCASDDAETHVCERSIHEVHCRLLSRHIERALKLR